MVKKKKIKGNFIETAILVAFFFALLSIVIVVLNHGFGFWTDIVLVIIMVFGYLIFKNKNKVVFFIKENKKIVCIVCLTLIVLGTALRLGFIAFGDRVVIDETLSDTGVHWYGSQQLSEEGKLNQEIGEYEAMFPFLFPYSAILSVFVSLFGNSIVAVVVSNTFFDILTGLLLFVLFYKWKKSYRAGLVAATVWMVNPLEIMFCSLPLAIVLVNMLIVASVLIVFLTFRAYGKRGTFFGLSALSGVVFAVGNAFRPIFIVFLLAYVLSMVVIVLRKKIIWKSVVLSSILCCAGFFVIGVIVPKIHVCLNSYYHGEKSQAGWSVYVGANYESKGQWNASDRDVFFGSMLSEVNGDMSLAQGTAMKRGIGRYLRLIKEGKIIDHYFNKVQVEFGDIENSIYDFPYMYGIKKESVLYKFTQNLILLYIYVMIAVVCYYALNVVKNKEWHEQSFNVLFLVVVFTGLFFSSMLVEVMNRYSLPFMAIFSLLAVGVMYDCYRNIVVKRGVGKVNKGMV